MPEFDRFLQLHAPHVDDDPTVDTSELLGARLTGRWKSGAPVQLTPLRDDPALAADASRNNVFTFDAASQEKCPFAAHVRKMNPRGDLDTETAIAPHRVIRRGIQYGPEVNDGERKSSRTERDRGLLFVCYSSNLADGFQFLQKCEYLPLLIYMDEQYLSSSSLCVPMLTYSQLAWANNVNFPINKPQLPGFDPLIGQVVDSDNVGDRSITGANPSNTAASLDLGMQTWVVPRGGEYFFSPSISVLRDVFAKKDASDEL